MAVHRCPHRKNFARVIGSPEGRPSGGKRAVEPADIFPLLTSGYPLVTIVLSTGPYRGMVRRVCPVGHANGAVRSGPDEVDRTAAKSIGPLKEDDL